MLFDRLHRDRANAGRNYVIMAATFPDIMPLLEIAAPADPRTAEHADTQKSPVRPELPAAPSPPAHRPERADEPDL